MGRAGEGPRPQPAPARTAPAHRRTRRGSPADQLPRRRLLNTAAAADGQVPDGAHELSTGQTNRVWYVGGIAPYVLKHYGDAARAANEAAALTLLARHGAPAPTLLSADPRADPPWTAQAAIHGEPVPVQDLLDELAEPLAAVHRIPGQHAGRLAGARRHRSWPDYLHDRLTAYAKAAPDLAPVAAALRIELDALALDGVEPRLLHHDLQPSHLVRAPRRLLLDWELAAFGDPLSDPARLAVRLRLPDPAIAAALVHRSGPGAGRRMALYWHIHLLADAAFATDPAVRAFAHTRLA
ncbi:phosphotransferase family protein [Streptomyces cyaneofuscatus]|uniref:phosphotransferase family protein n=1 Tax=Streptomyces cyaneofuscatus TaxID=66883 RepID=UPI003CF8DBBC